MPNFAGHVFCAPADPPLDHLDAADPDAKVHEKKILQLSRLAKPLLGQRLRLGKVAKMHPSGKHPVKQVFHAGVLPPPQVHALDNHLLVLVKHSRECQPQAKDSARGFFHGFLRRGPHGIQHRAMRGPATKGVHMAGADFPLHVDQRGRDAILLHMQPDGPQSLGSQAQVLPWTPASPAGHHAVGDHQPPLEKIPRQVGQRLAVEPHLPRHLDPRHRPAEVQQTQQVRLIDPPHPRMRAAGDGSKCHHDQESRSTTQVINPMRRKSIRKRPAVTKIVPSRIRDPQRFRRFLPEPPTPAPSPDWVEPTTRLDLKQPPDGKAAGQLYQFVVDARAFTPGASLRCPLPSGRA